MSLIRVGFVGLGGNCRLRHVPGLRACADVEISGVVNRRTESTAAAAKEYDIPKSYDHWKDLVEDTQIDAVVIGTWPYLHCEITLAALAAGKHVMTEARMAMNAAEAHRMFEASQKSPQLVTQIVPSPFGFHADQVIKEMIADGFLGELREVAVIGAHDGTADAGAPRSWRQSAEYSGLNTLTMGILHETLIRWVPDPISVIAQSQVFTAERTNPDTGKKETVGTPDSAHVLTQLPDGARGIYHFSGVTSFGPGHQIHLYGSEGTLKYMMEPKEHLLAARRGEDKLSEVEVPADKFYDWRVEQDFIEAIRGERKIELTDFATGVRYMEFTEAVARSAESGKTIQLPLENVG